ncbi:hypothetical protein HPB48_017161 [Haemaphysalis longicornis]|uniref:Peptidase M13 C-terminal domain-containing protein n=1 Tax=Haemaphysalis longicornis TaxID=44386 RepID=A0A9J6GMR6_HAELO|nr:hypothetical protein HPB48_017161 [Haemaphysalis longicornis]
MALNDSDAPPLNWASSIARSFNVSASWFDSDNVWVEQLTFLSSINNLLKAEVERRNLYGLAIAWSVVRDLGRFVDGGLSQLYGMNTPDAIVYCVRKIEQVTRPALTLPLYDKPKTDRLFLHVSRIFRYVQLATSEVVTSNIWMDSGTKQRTLSAARRLALRFPLPVNSRTGNWNQRLSPLGNNRSFFEEWKAAQGWMQEAEDTLEEPRAALDHAKASVGLNLATLQPPLFAPSLPVAVRFGGLGRMLAHELMHALFGELTAGNVSKPADSWPPNADEHYEGRLACFARSYGRYHVTPGRIPLDPERFSDVASAPVLWDAFRQQYPPSSSSAPASEDFRLPGMEAVDGRKLFFLAYCLTLCTEDEDVGSKSPGDFDHMPTPQQRCNVPLMHLEQFSSAFSCSKDDKMNPASKCSFW